MTGEWTDRMLYEALHKTGSIERDEAIKFLLGELYRRAYLMVTRTKHPDPEALAKDCAQEAIIKVLKNLDTCQDPDSFKGWARKIVRNQTLNELKKLGRLNKVTLEDEEEEDEEQEQGADTRSLEEESEKKDWFKKMMDELGKATWSRLSKQIVLGKFLDDKKDTKLAEELSRSEGRPMRPSHIQVIRTKDLNKLRGDDGLCARLRDLLE